LLVRTALADFDKSQRGKYCLARLENRDTRHLFHNHGLRAHVFGFELGLAVVE
jgi:hypothetical protein